VKLRVHDDTLEQDVEQIRRTREGVGDQVQLGVDANQGWRVAAIAECAKWDRPRAKAFCDAAGELDFAWVEEPLPQDDYEGLAELTAGTKVAIAGGELNNHGLPEFGHMVARGCYDWYQPDAVMVGGIAESMKIIEVIRAGGAVYTPHTWTNGIGFAINLAVFAASGFRDGGHLEYPIDPPGWVPHARDGLLTKPFLHEGGKLKIPDGPGLGFEIDRSALRRYGKKFSTSTKLRVSFAAVMDRGLSTARQLGATRQARLDERHVAVEALRSSGTDPMDWTQA
jgi:L-alanine-DL-glutamate epimerase-like enolase superfamily enzyme